MIKAKGDLPAVPAGSHFGELTLLETATNGRVMFACSCGDTCRYGLRGVVFGTHTACKTCEADNKRTTRTYRGVIESRTAAIRDMKGRNMTVEDKLTLLTPEEAAAGASQVENPAEYYDVAYSYLWKFIHGRNKRETCAQPCCRCRPRCGWRMRRRMWRQSNNSTAEETNRQWKPSAQTT